MGMGGEGREERGGVVVFERRNCATMYTRRREYVWNKWRTGWLYRIREARGEKLVVDARRNGGQMVRHPTVGLLCLLPLLFSLPPLLIRVILTCFDK